MDKKTRTANFVIAVECISGIYCDTRMSNGECSCAEETMACPSNMVDPATGEIIAEEGQVVSAENMADFVRFHADYCSASPFWKEVPNMVLSRPILGLIPLTSAYRILRKHGATVKLTDAGLEFVRRIRNTDCSPSYLAYCRRLSAVMGPSDFLYALRPKQMPKPKNVEGGTTFYVAHPDFN